MIADVDGNGLVDAADAAALTGQAGAALDEARLAIFVAGLNDNLVLEAGDDGLDATPAGLVSCVVCWIRCFGAMNQAADCADYCDAQFDACGDLGPIDQQAECWENVRRTCMPNCLAAVASAAGRCGSCVWKCAPKPGY